MIGQRIATGKHEGILPCGLRLPHGCVVGMCFAFGTTVGYLGLCVVSCAYGSPSACRRPVSMNGFGIGRGTSPHIASAATAPLVHAKGAVILSSPPISTWP